MIRMRQLTEERVAASFAELICADSQWVQAEFEAIVAANFPTKPPGRRPTPARGASGPPNLARRRRGLVRPGPRVPARPPAVRWRRQRSPPPGR